MQDNITLIELSAFSGLAGAILTQAITGLFAYVNDKRKYNNELKNTFRSKKMEIGESFYYITGEKMALIKTNIRYWKNWNDSRTEASLAFMNKEMKKLNQDMERLNAENWKYNLISLYFNVSFTNGHMLEANAISHRYYLSYLDVADKIKRAGDTEMELLYQEYSLILFNMCSHYDDVYKRLEHDMEHVKGELLDSFSIS